MKSASNLQSLHEISYTDVMKPEIILQWNDKATFQQMTLTLIHAIRYQTKFKNLQKKHDSWIESWTIELKRKIKNNNLQQAMLKAMERWCDLHKNIYQDSRANLNHNTQMTISNFLDYTALCLKFSSHQAEKRIAIMLLHLIILHTSPGDDTHNIQKYFTLRSTLQTLYKETGLYNPFYKNVLLVTSKFNTLGQLATLSNLINLSIGLIIGVTCNAITFPSYLSLQNTSYVISTN